MTVDLAASVAIILDGQILLIKRADFAVWALPGGQVEAGESFADAAVREAREETGLVVQLTRLVGIYFAPGWPTGDNHNVLFAAKPVGGALRPQAGEVIEERYFGPCALPESLIWWHRQRIRDAMSGVGGSAVWTQHAIWPFEETMALQTVYDLIPRSGLSRQGFFLKHFSKPEPEPEDLEVLEVSGKQGER
jgi:8-oxo-dGTP diphosphatase